jgi:hypothetical protein
MATSMATEVRLRPAVGAAAAELICLIACVEVIMWVVPLVPDSRAAYAGLVLVIIALLITCHLRDHPGARSVGFRIDNLFTTLAHLSAPLAAFAACVIAIGFAAGSVRFGARFFTMLASVPLWALLQQYMLLVFVGRRVEQIIEDRGKSRLVIAALFALLHLPNPALTVACALGGYVWAREFDRSPNLLANALTHTIASALLANSLPGWALKNMVVGYNYFMR